jgi:glycosyltransferase involved in cell wall biosynthesis
MSNRLSVSIAMCTYNGERHLPAQLDSVLNQTTPPDELIICDDASQDRTEEIIEAFARQAPFPVRFLKNKVNLGYVKNFEQAIGLCTQDIVFLCDHDDVWAPSKIASVLSSFQAESQVGLVLHNFSNIDGQGRPYLQPPEKYGLKQLLAADLPEELRQHSIQSFLLPHSRAWCGCMMAFRQTFKNTLLPIFPGKGHDDWIIKILAPLTGTRFIDQALIQYRIHENNANSHEFALKGISFRLQKFINKLKKAIKGHSKRNFYIQVIQRIHGSGMEIQYPHLITLYQGFIRLL